MSRLPLLLLLAVLAASPIAAPAVPPQSPDEPLAAQRPPGDLVRPADPQLPPAGSDPLLAARTLVVSGAAEPVRTNRDIWNPNASRAAMKVEDVMRGWGRYKVVMRTEDADLVLLVTERQEDFAPDKPARLVAQLKVYAGHRDPGPDTAVLWSDETVEFGSKHPSTRVAELFRDYVKKAQKARK